MRRNSIILALALLLFVNTAFASEKKTEQSSIEKVVAWYEKNLNYGTITLLMTVESSFIPFPSEVVVPPAAYKSMDPESDMNIILVVVFATLGAILGALANYYLAMWLGRPIIYKFAESKIGKMCLLSKESVQKAEAYFNKHGKSSTFIGRLIPAIRQLISIPAGLARMKLGSFLLYTTIGAMIWNIVLAILGYLAHGQKDIINKYSSELSYVLFALGALFVLYLIYKGFFSKKKAKNA